MASKWVITGIYHTYENLLAVWIKKNGYRRNRLPRTKTAVEIPTFGHPTNIIVLYIVGYIWLYNYTYVMYIHPSIRPSNRLIKFVLFLTAIQPFNRWLCDIPFYPMKYPHNLPIFRWLLGGLSNKSQVSFFTPVVSGLDLLIPLTSTKSQRYNLPLRSFSHGNGKSPKKTRQFFPKLIVNRARGICCLCTQRL